MNYLQDLGALAIASRLKALSELFMRDMADIYNGMEIDFEPRCFTFIHLINERGPLPITTIARELNQSHPAANQVANILEKKKYITSNKDRKDGRKRVIKLSPRGIVLVNKLTPTWQAVEQSVSDFLNEVSPDFLAHMKNIEDELIKNPMKQRIQEQIKNRSIAIIDIIPFSQEYETDFKSLNEQWINKFFVLETEDAKLLDNPEKEILKKGGSIVFARLENRIVGTCALLKIDSTTCELTKMAVDPDFQGRQIGRSLLQFIIAEAQDKSFKKMILLTSEVLNKALSLYRSEGFTLSNKKSVLEHNLKRCSIQLEKNI